jgi:murein DD-endopeptidase MepM/ murein hydrolase activator NlpD
MIKNISTFMLTICAFVLIVSEAAYAQYTTTWPCSVTSISSPFGWRNGRMHQGCDIPLPNGSPLISSISGTVRYIDQPGGAGTGMAIRSSDGSVEVKYFHLQARYAPAGSTVNAGDVIGETNNTGSSSGPHLHYELWLRTPSGASIAVDPVLAQGKDLSDPNIVAMLIEDAIEHRNNQSRGETTINGSLTGTGTGTYGSGFSIGPSTGGASAGDMSCSSEILSTGQQLSEARMNLEAQQVNEAITPPGAVGQMACLDQFGELFNSQIGNIFGDGLEIFNFGGIFTDTQNALNNSINNAISNNLLGGRGANITQSISTTITDAFNSMLGNPSAGSFTCEAMNILWEIMQCEGILDFKIPSLQELIGGGIGSGLADMLEGLKPDSCAGEALYNSAITAADRTFSSFLENSPLNPSTIEANASSY